MKKPRSLSDDEAAGDSKAPAAGSSALSPIWRLIEGETEAWENLVREFSPIIHSSIRKSLANRSGDILGNLTEELTQDVYLRLVEHDYRLLRRYDPAKATLGTWLCLIARSVALNALERKRLPTVSLDEAPEISVPSVAPGVFDPLPEGLLTADEENLVHLLFEDGLTAGEAAKHLNLSIQTVYNNKSVILAKLRSCMAPE